MLTFFSTCELKTTKEHLRKLTKIYDQDRHKRIKRSPWFGSKEICAVIILEWHTWLDFSSEVRLINMAEPPHNTRTRVN